MGLPDRSTIRVVSYNVHGQRDDRAAMTELIRSLAPDVVLVQEAPRRLRWRTRCADLAARFGLYYAAGGLPALGNLVLVAARVRLLAGWCLRFPLTPGRHLRGAAFARCAVGDSTFVVAGTHLSTEPAERLAQASLLVDALADARLRYPEDPMLLAGDLNDTAGSPAWQRLVEGRTDAADAAAVAGTAESGTYPAWAPKRRIDAIFCDPDLPVRAYRVVDGQPAQRASDHLPVLADVVLPTRSH